MATKSKTKTSKKSTKAAPAAKKNGGAPRYHMPDSPKSQVHKAFDTKGKKAAEALAAKLEVTNGRTQRWLREWGQAA